MDTFITLILLAFTVIVIAYGADFICLLHWIMRSGFEKQPAVNHSKLQHPLKPLSNTSLKKDNCQLAMNRIISDFSSMDKSKRLSATKLIIKFPPRLLEEKLLPFISDSRIDSEIATSAAEILLENGRETIIPDLALFFSRSEKGIAGFLDDRGYNKVVNLFK